MAEYLRAADGLALQSKLLMHSKRQDPCLPACMHDTYAPLGALAAQHALRVQHEPHPLHGAHAQLYQISGIEEEAPARAQAHTFVKSRCVSASIWTLPSAWFASPQAAVTKGSFTVTCRWRCTG